MVNWWSTDFDEADAAAVADAVRSRHLSCGPIVREFEERLAEALGVPFVVCTTSGTTALTLALAVYGVGAGDEVIVPDRTWIATAHAVMATGATVRLADVGASGLLDDPHRRAPFTIPVNLNGSNATVPAFGLVIEDSCQNFPSPPRGTMACYSFSSAKLIPTGQGGAVATTSEGAYRDLLALRTHGIANPESGEAWSRFGFNFRYTDPQAAIGLVQLRRLKAKVDRLQEIRAIYGASLPPWLTLLPTEGIPLYTEALHPDPASLIAHLAAHGIQARPFYPLLHTAPYLKPPHKTRYMDYEFPNANRFAKGLTLPSGPAQTNQAIQRTIEVIHAYQR